MSTKIFYFSGSGNSLAIARTIAAGLGDAEILPIAKSAGGFTGTDEERLGIVTPVYAWGMPRMIVDFAKRFKSHKGQYVFAVADCAGTPGKTLIQLRKQLRVNGSDLDAGFAVRGDFLASLTGMGDMPIIKLVQKLAGKSIPLRAGERLDEIVKAVSNRERHKPETANLAVNLIGSMMYAGAMKMFKNGDRDFSVGDACVSCGTCTKICPRENVRLVDDRPTWHQDCEMCYACYLWCPQKAISYKGEPPTDPTHHPDVSLEDMILR